MEAMKAFQTKANVQYQSQMYMARHKRAHIYKVVVQIYVSTVVSRRNFQYSISMADSYLTQLVIQTRQKHR